MNRDHRIAILGLVLLLPALLLVSTGLFHLDLTLPGALVHPVPLMGGLLIAFALNGLHLLRARFGYEDGAVVGTMSLRLRGAGLNLTALGLSAVLLATISVYLFVENFQPR